MSKHRVVKSDFWVDDYIENLQVKERYFFLYLLTNPNTNILGIYQNTLKRMSFETDLEKTDVESILHKFSEDDKVHFVDSYIIMVNFQTHQTPNDTMKTGINKLFNSLPDSVIKFIYSKESKVYDRLRIGYPIAYVYLHKDKDKNKGIDKDKNKGNKNPIPAPDPEKYELKKSTVKWALKKGISELELNDIKEKCFVWHGSKGNHYVDWDKTLQTWVNKEDVSSKGNSYTTKEEHEFSENLKHMA